MTLVDANTGEVVAELTPDAARVLTDRIKVAVEATWHLVTEAYQSRAWSALGYSSWDDYCTREFGTSRLRLPREDRQEVVASLRDSGMSIRAIAAATGLSHGTVGNEVSKSGHLSDVAEADRLNERDPLHDDGSVIKPGDFGEDYGGDLADPVNPDGTKWKPSKPAPKVTGTDGKSYPAAPKAPKPRRNPIEEQARAAGWELRKAVERIERIAADDRYSTNKEQVAAQWVGHLTNAVEVCQDLLDGFTTEPQEAR